jgi:hypothetical protein
MKKIPMSDQKKSYEQLNAEARRELTDQACRMQALPAVITVSTCRACGRLDKRLERRGNDE